MHVQPIPLSFSQVVWWLVREEVCNGDRASAVRLGQDMVSHRLLTPLCAGYDRPRSDLGVPAAGDRTAAEYERDPSRSFDDAVGWLFALAGDALRDPFAPPPPTQVAVMTNTGVDVRVTGWKEVRGFGLVGGWTREESRTGSVLASDYSCNRCRRSWWLIRRRARFARRHFVGWAWNKLLPFLTSGCLPFVGSLCGVNARMHTQRGSDVCRHHSNRPSYLRPLACSLAAI